ncbi:MAG: hypothetical protein EOO10_00390 [Chitinophagaceae bacterium]|nr:MAG: hypothetical protein EOO10_00390 [Chitinophagaceae bacterium]
MKALLPLFLFLSFASSAQDIPIEGQKRIFFPYPMDKGWQTSLGFTSTTMPRDITEEAHFRIPAGDIHVLRKLGKKLYADARVNFQVIQNLITIGPRLPIKLSDRISMALGNDIGFWFGRINVASIKTRGQGFQNYPNVAFGYRFNKGILLTVRAESIMNFGVKTKAAETPVTSDYRLFSGSAYSIILEQPFAGSKSMTLGFRALYTDYYWQTWTLFENYERNLFFPQIIVGLIL